MDAEIKNLLQLGLFKKANQLFIAYAKDIATGKKDARSEQHKKMILEYSKITERVSKATTIIMTHKRLVLLKSLENIQTVIIDEDIIPTFIKTSTISLNELDFLIQGDDLENWYRELYESIKAEPFEKVVKTPKYVLDYKPLEKQIRINANSLDSNIIEFLNSTHYMKQKNGCISYVSNRSVFPKNKRYIMLSATVTKEMAHAVWGNRICFEDIGLIELKGKVVLHHNLSYSRYSMNNQDFEGLSKQLKKTHGDNLKVITFKQFSNLFQDSGIEVAATFGATTGLNQYSGEDLVVVGTPHFPPSKYLLTAATLGLITSENCNIYEQKIQLQ